VIQDPLRPELRAAIDAAQSKQAGAVTLLDLRELGAFTDFFLICTAFSPPQMHAVADAIEESLFRQGRRCLHNEGRDDSEWRLLDYGGLVVHIFSERGRFFYDLDRLWRAAKRLDIAEADPGASQTAG